MTQMVWKMMLLLCFIVPANASSQQIIGCQRFVKSSTYENYKECRRFLGKNGREQVHALELLRNEDIYKGLLETIGRRNEFGVRLGYILFKFADGSKKEDIAIELGGNFTHNSRLLLMLFVKNKFSDEDVRTVLLNYGEEYVDDLEKTHLETKRRIEKISAVQDRGLSEIKLKCLQMLNAFDSKVLELRK